MTGFLIGYWYCSVRWFYRISFQQKMVLKLRSAISHSVCCHVHGSGYWHHEGCVIRYLSCRIKKDYVQWVIGVVDVIALSSLQCLDTVGWVTEGHLRPVKHAAVISAGLFRGTWAIANLENSRKKPHWPITISWKLWSSYMAVGCLECSVCQADL